MKRSCFFLLACLVLYGCAIALILSGALPPWAAEFEVGLLCGLTAGVGGVVYCLRGIYVNTCAGDGWNPKWMPWYFIRPIVSLVCGVVSYLLLKAGLLVLDSAPREATNHMGLLRARLHCRPQCRQVPDEDRGNRPNHVGHREVALCSSRRARAYFSSGKE